MDQAKWSIPRLRGHQVGKEMGKFQRPRLKLHAVWGAACGLYLFLVDPRQSADASMVVEAATLTLEKIKAKLGDRMPAHLVVGCDNTVRENKNNTCLQFLAWMTAKNYFRTCSMMMAQVGHTHNALGISDLLQLYGFFDFMMFVSYNMFYFIYCDSYIPFLHDECS